MAMARARAMQAARLLLRRSTASLPEFHQVSAPLRSLNSSDFSGFEGWRAGGVKRLMHAEVSAAGVGRGPFGEAESETSASNVQTELLKSGQYSFETIKCSGRNIMNVCKDDFHYKEEDDNSREEKRMVTPFESPVALEAPVKVLYELLQKKGFIDEKVRPLPIDQVASQEDHRIVAWYRSIGIGLLRYYSYCDNLSKVRAIVNYLLRWSAIYTLAKKHKSSSSKIIATRTKSLVISKDGKTLAAYLTPTEISEYKKKFIVDLDPTPPGELIDMLFARLVRKRLLAERCAVKGCEERHVEMHHIRQIEKAGVRHKVRSAREAQILEGIKAVQNALNKKHIPLCVRHHDDLHMGRVFIDDLDMNIVI